MIINHGNLARVFTGLKSNFMGGFKLAVPLWRDVTTVIPSTTEKEDYPWLGVASRMREWIDDRVIQSIGTHKYQLINRDFELTQGVETNKIADDTFGVYAPLTEQMGQTVGLHPDELIFSEVISNGGDANSLGYDDVPFYSDVHPNEFTGPQTNQHLDGAGPPWYLADFSGPIRPFIFQLRQAPRFITKQSLTDDEVFHRRRFLFGVDSRYEGGYGLWQQTWKSNRTLVDVNLEAAWLAMTTRVSDNGYPYRFKPTHLLVPEILRFDAERLLKRELVVDSGAAVGNIHRGRLQLIVSQFLV